MRTDRLGILLKQNRKLFHTQDLALLWGISSKNTLYTTISRYLKNKILFQIHKGFYSVIPVEEIDKYELGLGYLHRFAYVSCETVLSDSEIIQQKIYPVTFISSISTFFKLGDNDYLSRKLKQICLFNSIGVYEKNGVLFAETSRAVADLLYYNPRYHFDNVNLIDSERVKYIQKAVNYD